MEIIETTNSKGSKSYTCEDRHVWACMDVATTGESTFQEWWQCTVLVEGYFKNHNRVETFKEAVNYLLKKGAFKWNMAKSYF